MCLNVKAGNVKMHIIDIARSACILINTYRLCLMILGTFYKKKCNSCF